MDLAISVYAYLVVTATSLKDRLADEDRGFIAAETAAMYGFSALIVIAIFRLAIDTDIANHFQASLDKMFIPPAR